MQKSELMISGSSFLIIIYISRKTPSQMKVYNPLISANGGLLYYRDLENYIDTEKSKEYFINTAGWLVKIR